MKINNTVNFNGINSMNNNKLSNNVLSLINKDRITDTFCKIVKVDTGSDPDISEREIPSTSGQRVLANILAEELRKLNLEEINISDNAIVTATLPSNIGSDPNLPVIGLLAHMDTSNSVPSGPVTPQTHNYTNGNIVLKDGVTILEKDLTEHKNEQIITSDGTTLLGADDKAGIAEIIEALKIFNEHPELKHPKIRIAFTPDEETGNGISKFNIKNFGVDVAYTIDGDSPNVIENETFNAFNPEITIKGINIHPGSAYNVMVNSISIASDFINKIPNERPETTKEKEGYYHIADITGNEETTKIKMLVRDFNYDKACERIKTLENLINDLKKDYPKSEITFNPNPKYRNMKEKLKELPEVVDYAKEGIKKTGLIPEEKAIRGGTDGSQLTLRNLLTPNLGTGGHNFHSKNEFVSVQDMQKCTANIINTLAVWAEKAQEIMPKILERRNNSEK